MITFCFLDEVDANLDHANSLLLAQLLKNISQDRQVVMVTHQEEVMEVADQIIGVTMNDPGFPRQFVLTGNLFNRKRRDMMEKKLPGRMGERYGKMKEEVKEHFSQLWSKRNRRKDWEELEELLIQADMGPALSLEIVEEFREFKKSRRR